MDTQHTCCYSMRSVESPTSASMLLCGRSHAQTQPHNVGRRVANSTQQGRSAGRANSIEHIPSPWTARLELWSFRRNDPTCGRTSRSIAHQAKRSFRRNNSPRARSLRMNGSATYHGRGAERCARKKGSAVCEECGRAPLLNCTFVLNVICA